MPTHPKRPCPRAGCPHLISRAQRACPDHSREREQARGSARERGYNARWERARKVYLATNPLCHAHERQGLTELATVVDHIRPHRGDQALFWNAAENWQGLCSQHHGIKGARERGVAPCHAHGEATATVSGILTCMDCGQPAAEGRMQDHANARKSLSYANGKSRGYGVLISPEDTTRTFSAPSPGVGGSGMSTTCKESALSTVEPSDFEQWRGGLTLGPDSSGEFDMDGPLDDAAVA